MKVEQKVPKKEFIPITITLETEDEALAMWGYLNIDSTTTANINTTKSAKQAIIKQGFRLHEIFHERFSPSD